jgi:hypothetical protein
LVSFTRLGCVGRLGNQFFQYAFLRVTADRLGVPFHCPAWLGDSIFDLGDREQRVELSGPTLKKYVAPRSGFLEEALELTDQTDIEGYFQSELYYPHPQTVRSWFRWRPEMVEQAQLKYRDIDFSDSIAIHMRFGDFYSPKNLGAYYLPTVSYYRCALRQLDPATRILVFSDEPETARWWLYKLVREHSQSQFHFVNGNKDWEDLYLMSRCRDHICSPSSFAWWGAWLAPGGKKVAPSEGPLRPASGMRNDHYWPRSWILCPALTNRSVRERCLIAFGVTRFTLKGIVERIRRLFGAQIS